MLVRKKYHEVGILTGLVVENLKDVLQVTARLSESSVDGIPPVVCYLSNCELLLSCLRIKVCLQVISPSPCRQSHHQCLTLCSL